MRELEKHIGLVRRHSSNLEDTSSEQTQYRHSQSSSTCSSEEQPSVLDEGAVQYRDVQHRQSHSEPIAIAVASAAVTASMSRSKSTGLEHEQAGKNEDQLYAGRLAIDGTRTVLQTTEAMLPTSETSADKHIIWADVTFTKPSPAKLSTGDHNASRAAASEDADNASVPSRTYHAAPAIRGSASTGLQSSPQAAPRKPFAYGLKGGILQHLLHIWDAMTCTKTLRNKCLNGDRTVTSHVLPLKYVPACCRSLHGPRA